MDNELIGDLLSEIEILLITFNQKAWTQEVHMARSAFVEDPHTGRIKVLSLYGGLGSLKDLVLYANGIPLIYESNKLQDLCEELFRELHL